MDHLIWQHHRSFEERTLYPMTSFQRQTPLSSCRWFLGTAWDQPTSPNVQPRTSLLMLYHCSRTPLLLSTTIYHLSSFQGQRFLQIPATSTPRLYQSLSNRFVAPGGRLVSRPCLTLVWRTPIYFSWPLQMSYHCCYTCREHHFHRERNGVEREWEWMLSVFRRCAHSACVY